MLPGLIGSFLVGLPLTLLSLAFVRGGGGSTFFGLATFTAGLWILALPWIHYRRLRRTSYVLTDLRLRVGNKDYPLEALTDVSCLASRQGDGDVCARFGGEAVDLQGIENVGEVVRLIHQLRPK